MNVKEAIEKLKLYPEDTEVTSLAVDLLKKPNSTWSEDDGAGPRCLRSIDPKWAEEWD